MDSQVKGQSFCRWWQQQASTKETDGDLQAFWVSLAVLTVFSRFLALFDIFYFDLSLSHTNMSTHTPGALAQNGYFGKFIGSFPPDSVHNVKGKVYAASDDSLYIQVSDSHLSSHRRLLA